MAAITASLCVATLRVPALPTRLKRSPFAALPSSHQGELFASTGSETHLLSTHPRGGGVGYFSIGMAVGRVKYLCMFVLTVVNALPHLIVRPLPFVHCVVGRLRTTRAAESKDFDAVLADIAEKFETVENKPVSHGNQLTLEGCTGLALRTATASALFCSSPATAGRCGLSCRRGFGRDHHRVVYPPATLQRAPGISHPAAGRDNAGDVKGRRSLHVVLVIGCLLHPTLQLQRWELHSVVLPPPSCPV
jgi:hypothetical protein